MERFATSIESSLNSQNWFAALFMALALPDICAALEEPNRPVGERYKDWFKRYLQPAYDPAAIDDEFEYIANKLRIPVEELRTYHAMPLKTYRDYRNRFWMFDLGAKALKLLGVERSIKR